MVCALNVELKPAQGAEYETGLVVASLLAREWRGRLPPLLSSFRIDALQGARAGAASLPRALLVGKPAAACPELAREQGCVAVVAEHRHVVPCFVEQIREAGLALLGYTVNDEAEAGRLMRLGVHGLITDRVDRFDPDRHST
jgi:glycerophosphoryl diester phosphodiesterase